MEITDQFYSNLNGEEIKRRIDALRKEAGAYTGEEAELELFRQFVIWRQNHQGATRRSR
jgi:hypothetical protein